MYIPGTFSFCTAAIFFGTVNFGNGKVDAFFFGDFRAATLAGKFSFCTVSIFVGGVNNGKGRFDDAFFFGNFRAATCLGCKTFEGLLIGEMTTLEFLIISLLASRRACCSIIWGVIVSVLKDTSPGGLSTI